jgi:UMF1 family MFS transporter
MYDWANSAFATTILAAVLPVYFSQVAGATLPSAAVATAYWSFGYSFSLLIIAILSPILGTISDIMRGKKRFLAIFAGIGILGTALLVLVSTGDWLLASILAIIGRIGFSGANSFYDALLAHVAREEDRDRVSARGFATGYLGGGLLLAINIVMIQFLPGAWGARLSFLSVAIWWAVFSIPLFRYVPEPLAAPVQRSQGQGVVALSFKRLAETLRDIRRYRELFKFLLAFLIYNDGIGTIIGVAAIYGAEMGFGAIELILALLLVQFVGIPYSLIFGRLPAAGDKRRPFFLAFVLFNLVALPAAGIFLARTRPAVITGAPPAPFVSQDGFAGEGAYTVADEAISLEGDWQMLEAPAGTLGAGATAVYGQTGQPGALLEFAFNGQKVDLVYGQGPDHGRWAVELDGAPLPDEDTGQPVTIEGYHPTARYEVIRTILAPEPGQHTLRLRNTGERDPASQGTLMSVARLQVLPGLRQSSLGYIIGMILVVELAGLVFAFFLGNPLFSGMAQKMDTKRSILLALVVYSVIAVWGFFLNSVVEFWFLAWMVAIVQGGSQALSRSLYAGMSPAAKSGEFFGLFGVMEKFSAIIGPLLFGLAGTVFGSSRPAVLSLIALFILGGLLLTLVNVEEGKRAAKAEDEALLQGAAGD